MSIPPLLVLNAFGSLPLQVHELVGGTTVTQIGSDISTGTPQVFVPGIAIKSNYNGFVKTFKGERYALTIGSATHIRREDEGGAGAWGIVFTFSTAIAFNSPEYTLQLVKDGNDTALVAAWIRGSAPHVVMGKSNDGASWSESTFDLGFLGRMTSTTVVFRNRLYWCDGISTASGAPSRVYELDPATASITTISAPWPGNGASGFLNSDLCVAFDRLFCAATDLIPGNPAGTLKLYEFTGGGFTLNSSIGSTAGHNSEFGVDRGKWCLWTDNTNLYCVGYTRKDSGESIAEGSSVWRGVPSGSSFIWTQNDTTMLTARRPGTGGSDDRQHRWSIYVDNDTDPANPVYYLILTLGPAPGTGHAIYVWNGFGVEMGPTPGASVSIDFALPETKHGGGEAISQGVASFAEIESEEPVVGGYRLSYRVASTQGPFTGRVYFSTEQGPPDTLATLIGGGTTIAAVTGDSRASLRTVDIDLGLSGITSPDASTWMIDLR